MDRVFHISKVYSLWRDLSHHAMIVHIVTLTLKFDILFKTSNLYHSLWTVRDRAFIFHMCIPCGQDLSHHTIIFDLVTLTLNFESHTLNVGFPSANSVVFWQLLQYMYICDVWTAAYCTEVYIAIIGTKLTLNSGSMCRLRNKAMRDYQESVITGQTLG